ncbi:MAG: 4Fe-4S binding protein [Smithellaceae bacterium]|nr:4Fe-4S binding protein [Smithellaceae bacterium]
MKTRRKIVKIDEDKCDGCGVCVSSCAEGAIRIVDGKARLVAEKYCDGLGACLRECPRGALSVVEELSDAFDEDAVKEHLSGDHREVLPVLECGCPSSHIETFGKGHSSESAGKEDDIASELRHWPVQLRLVPPTAGFLKNADLLIAADCTAVACPNFHRLFLRGRAILMGCPKFDDVAAYEDKLARIFAGNDVRSIKVVVMEVPCCQGMPVIVQKALAASGKDLPVQVVVIGSRGNIVKDTLPRKHLS